MRYVENIYSDDFVAAVTAESYVFDAYIDGSQGDADLAPFLEVTRLGQADGTANIAHGDSWRRVAVDLQGASTLWKSEEVAQVSLRPTGNHPAVDSFTLTTTAQGLRLSIGLSNPRWSRSRFDEMAEIFEESVKSLGTYYAVLEFAKMSWIAKRAIGTWMGEFRRNPIHCYAWLQAYDDTYQLETAGGAVDRGRCGASRLFRLGETPIVPLAQRDELRQILAPELPPSSTRVVADPPLPGWCAPGVLASPDGGTELSDDLATLTEPHE